MIEQSDGNFRVCDTVSTVRQARTWLSENKVPDLIICDVELEDGLGFQIFGELDIAPPVIYCAASRQYAMEAFANNGIDYLLQPVCEESVRRSLSKFSKFKEFLSFEQTIDASAGSRLYIPPNTYKSFLLSYYKDKIIPVSLEQAEYLYYNNCGVTIHTADAKYETRDTLNNIIVALNPNVFFRANRQFIIHRKAVKSIRQYFGRKLLIDTNIATPEPVIISKANASEFLRWVEGIHHNAMPVQSRRSA
ncbi:hypothetical protein ASG33_21145 [Dyadobacter sp. Leaf189]|nr:hypothetical protein ASG33_21145 [Dyadobacter sp. Leaf189]